ncbi:MAG: hypothetical protein AB1611_04655 [bacterium]
MTNFTGEVKIQAVLPRIMCAGLCFFLTLSVVDQSPAEQQSSSPAFREQLNREISNLFQPSRAGSQRSFSSSAAPVPLKCGTPLIRQALRHRELLNPENRFILHRPTDPPTDPYDDYYEYNVRVWYYDTPHFRFYYTEDGYWDRVEGSDGIQETIPAFVTAFASYFEESWSFLVSDPHGLGYRAPVSQKIEVFILSIGAYGITSADSRGLYILVDNTYQRARENLDNEGKAAGAMKVTAVHELFHAFQAGYDQWPTSPADTMWWEENTAVWVEDEFYDSVDDYLNYLGQPFQDDNDNGRYNTGEQYFTIEGNELTYGRDSGWFDYPDVSLNKTSDDPPYYRYLEYGGVIWAKFLSERFGSGIVRSVFERMLPPSYDVLTATSQSLEEISGGRTSFAHAFTCFKLANLEQDYEEGSKYPIPRHDTSINYLEPLSCQYLIFSEPAQPGSTIRIQVDGDSQTDIAFLAVPSGSYQFLPESRPQFGTAQLIPLDGNQQGTYDFSFTGSQDYSKLIIIPINRSRDTMASYALVKSDVPPDELPPVPQLAGPPSARIKDGYLSIRLAWEPVRETGRYQVWRGQAGEYQTMIFQSEEIVYPYQDSNAYEDTDPAFDGEQTYLYQVKFANSAGDSSSETVPVTTPKFPLFNAHIRYKTAAAPTPSVEISFEVDPNILAYQIERKIKGTSSTPDTLVSRKEIESSDRSITYDDYQAQANTEYLYIITAYNAQDDYFRKEVSIRLPQPVVVPIPIPPPSQKESSGCFITAVL